MSMKKSDLDKQLAMKIDGRMKGAGIPGRFGHDAGNVTDRREQRRLDAAAGLVPFACKLPAELAATLRERGAADEGGINGVVAALLRQALAAAAQPAAKAGASDKPAPAAKAEKGPRSDQR